MSTQALVKALVGQTGFDRLREIRNRVRLATAPLRKGLIRRRLENSRVTPNDLAKRQGPVTVFFAPEAGVAPFFASHCMLARALQDAGHSALIAGCFDLYPRCVVMDSRGQSTYTQSERTEICNACGKNAADWTAEYGLDSVDIGSLLTAADHARIDALLASPPADMRDFEVDGIAFGKITGSEASVTLKTLDFAGREPQTRKVLLQYLRGSLISYFAMKRLMATIPVARIVYFSEYSLLLGAVLAARAGGIAISNMSHAHIMTANRQRPTLHSYPIALLSYRGMLREWAQWRQLALSPSRVDDIFDDIFFRFTSDAVMVYSRQRTGGTDALFRKLELHEGKPLLVAFTSSLDEIYANRHMLEAVGGEPFSTEQPFQDQIEWLRFLIGQAEEKDNFQLVIRIHPREGSTRREATSSQHLDQLRENFGKPYRNVRLIWPGDEVSSYDLMELADAGTSAWSSTAMEMARLGAPTVIAFQNYTPMPIGDVVAWGRTPEAYLEALNRAMEAPPSLDQVQHATRWMNMRIFGNSIDLSDIVPRPDFAGLPAYKRPAASAVIEDVLISGKTTLAANHQMLQAKQDAKSEDAEMAAIQRNLRRAAWLFSLGEPPERDYVLHYGFLENLPPAIDAACWRDGSSVIFKTRNQTFRRRSRLVDRLAGLCAQTQENGLANVSQ
jgi:hypothetical protein